MEPIFNNDTTPHYRLIFVLLLSLALIFFDHQIGGFDQVRGYLQSLVSPLQYVANAPKQILTWIAENTTTRNQLIKENQHYKINELKLTQQLVEFDIVKRENARLRSLLASPLRSNIKKMVAEIISVNNDPYSQQVVINRGANDGVFDGQPVIDERGIVGQILHVGTTSSRVLLITDLTHSIPVRIQRNGIRLIATGSGQLDQLNHNYVPHSTDIHPGDLLVSSGLGGKFPEDYPVARVTKVIQNESRPFALVVSKPLAQLDRLRYLLLLWPEKKPQMFSPKPVSKAKKNKVTKQSKRGSKHAQ